MDNVDLARDSRFPQTFFISHNLKYVKLISLANEQMNAYANNMNNALKMCN